MGNGGRLPEEGTLELGFGGLEGSNKLKKEGQGRVFKDIFEWKGIMLCRS